jgi:hypothetical protein
MNGSSETCEWMRNALLSLDNIDEGLGSMATLENRFEYEELDAQWKELSKESAELRSLLEMSHRLADVNRKDLWRIYVDLCAIEKNIRASIKYIVAACTSLLDRSTRLKEVACEQSDGVGGWEGGFKNLTTKAALLECCETLKTYQATLMSYYGMYCHFTGDHSRALYNTQTAINNLETSVRAEIQLADSLQDKCLMLFQKKCSLYNDLLYFHDRKKRKL